MIQNRVTALRDTPDPKLLEKYGRGGYRVFKHVPTGIFYLDLPGETETPFEQLIMDETVLSLEKSYDTSFVDAFKQNNSALMGDTILYDYVIEDALWVSEIFQTRVLSYYANDEDCDFVAVAENGKLLRLRIKAGRKELRQLSAGEAQAITTEISAVKILPDDDDDGVSEYEAYEAIQTEGTPLQLTPYHRYFEGELSREVIFKTLSFQPDGVAPNLMFRNIHAEFPIVFGCDVPDFFDPKADEFELVSSFTPDPNPAKDFMQTVGALLLLPFELAGALVLRFVGVKRPSQVLKIVIGAGLISLGIIARYVAPQSPPKTDEFHAQCSVLGGALATENSCAFDGRNYTKMDIPGRNGEVIKFGVTIDAEKMACRSNAQQCLVIAGKPFSGTIGDFSHKPGVKSLVIVERTQLCHLIADASCTDETAYEYKAVQQIDL